MKDDGNGFPVCYRCYQGDKEWLEGNWAAFHSPLRRPLNEMNGNAVGEGIRSRGDDFEVKAMKELLGSL